MKGGWLIGVAHTFFVWIMKDFRVIVTLFLPLVYFCVVFPWCIWWCSVVMYFVV